jgi:hypothetical protein
VISVSHRVCATGAIYETSCASANASYSRSDSLESSTHNV